MGKNDNTLVKNASFLMVAALISKIIGMLYKSPLSTTLGSQSFALFQFAQNVYFILLMIASFSIPQAVSKIMAEKIAFHRYKDAQKVFYGALIYAAVAGGIVALICVFGAGILVPDSMANARLALQMLAPTIFHVRSLRCIPWIFPGIPQYDAYIDLADHLSRSLWQPLRF